MKHLLIILISILLLSSPVIGDSHKGETLYWWNISLKTSIENQWKGIGEYVWKGFGEKDTNPMYQGEVENGVPNGLGVLIFPDGGKYIGSWKNGIKYGHGTFTYSYGSKYVGSWKNDERNGKGIMVFPDGSKWEGEYKDDWRWNGIRYYKDGKIWGKDVNGKWIDQSKKEGVMYLGNRNGEYGWSKSGDEKKDSKYVGEIRNGEPNGQGILTDSTRGYKYEGKWRDGQKTGHGIETQREYYSYEGRFKNGEHHGQGTFISFRNGKSKYIGEFRNNLPWNLNNYKDGKLIFIFVNGEKIEQ